VRIEEVDKKEQLTRMVPLEQLPDRVDQPVILESRRPSGSR